jgi:putative thioredoxin
MPPAAPATRRGKVKLVKMDIDEHPAVAGQLGIKSIPTVFVFINGRPVDGFIGAHPESLVLEFIKRLPPSHRPPDDAIIRLARALARMAAREYYAREMERQGRATQEGAS